MKSDEKENAMIELDQIKFELPSSKEMLRKLGESL